MSDIKLQVGEDYLNEFEQIVHIESYSSSMNLFRDGYENMYTENGKSVFSKTGNIKLNLHTHVPKVSKEPSDEEIRKAFYNCDEIIPAHIWKAAIEWYKQQIK